MTPEEKKWVEEVKGYCFRPSSPWINGRKDVDLPRAISIIEKQERMLELVKNELSDKNGSFCKGVCFDWLKDVLFKLEEMER